LFSEKKLGWLHKTQISYSNSDSDINQLVEGWWRDLHLEEMKKEIEELVLEKGFYNRSEDIPKKLLFAFIELGEASDAWKKGDSEEKIAEELIDVIFYILDTSRLACPSIDMDKMFKRKLIKNKNRAFQYGEGHRKRKRS
jgi:NTP pyrophosphatase (non-canonical NTP hydrolase)